MPRAKRPEYDLEDELSSLSEDDLRAIVRQKMIALDHPQPWYVQEKNKAIIAGALVCFVLYLILF